MSGSFQLPSSNMTGLELEIGLVLDRELDQFGLHPAEVLLNPGWRRFFAVFVRTEIQARDRSRRYALHKRAQCCEVDSCVAADSGDGLGKVGHGSSPDLARE